MRPSKLLKQTLYVLAILALIFAFVPAPANAEPPHQSGGLLYYVRPGDTLFWISQRFGTTVPAIMTANGLSTDYIQAGQRLIIPVGFYSYYPYGSSIYAPQPLPPTTPIANPTFNCSYTIRPGDTIFSISYRARVSVVSLMQANNLYAPLIFANQQIRIPCDTPTVNPFPTYLVVAGDNLLRIAMKYNTTIWALSLVNHIPNPNLIFAGQTLVIPYPNSYVWPAQPQQIVISQFRTRGPRGGSDEFIELYNASTTSMNIGNWTIRGSSVNGITDVRATVPADTQLGSGQHYLLGNKSADGYSASVATDLDYTNGIADDGGIALVNSEGTIVDQVGMSAGSVYKEGAPLTPLTTNDDRGYERKLGGANGNCQDTNSNTTDFQILAPSAPRSKASTVVACTGGIVYTRLVISQFRTRGPGGGNDEFVEIYNPTSQSANVGGWLIRASNATGAIGDRFTFPSNAQLNPGQHYLIGNNTSPGYGGTGSAAADQTYTTGITDDGGIALVMPDGTIVDQVGMSTATQYKEGTPLAPLTTNEDRGYERKPGGGNGNCQDTNNNANDFTLIKPSTPRNQSVGAINCNAAAAPAPGAVATNTPVGGNNISIQANAFFPPQLTVTVGTTVVWTNKDSGPHTIRSGTPGSGTTPLQSGTLNSGQTYSFTFPATGIYPYFDEINGATGSITVN